MSIETTTENEVLEHEVRRLEAEGYDVFVQPRPPQTPDFLGSFIPDAIAIGKDKKLVIEVKRNSLTADRALKELSARFAEQNEWELRVVLVSPRTAPITLPVQTPQQIEAAIREIKQLRDSGAVRPSFLMAWAALEAEARRLLGDQLGRPQTPGGVVQMLGQEGFLPPDEADAIRKLADVRNRLIHGELTVELSQASLDRLLGALGQLGMQEPLRRN
jgi:uncharacterized protein YutE (UPF0331/DUF86 family)